MVLAAIAVSGAAGGGRSVAADKDLATRIAALVGAHRKISKATVGVSVVGLADGRERFGLRANEPFIPASNQKILTSAFALSRLGGDFKFVTRCDLIGKDLWVFGSGDPLLGDPLLAKRAGCGIYDELDRWSVAVRGRLGRRAIADVVVVPSFTGPKATQKRYRHKDWPSSQHHRWYCAPAAGLNFHNNCFDVTFTVRGEKITPHVAPASKWIRVVNQVRKGPRQIWSLRASQDDSVVTLRGTVKQTAREPISAPVSDPPMLFARVLADRLRRAGATITGHPRTADAPPEEFSADHPAVCTTTTALTNAMARANKRSLNMAAECILLRAGDGTWPGSARQMTETLVAKFGLSPDRLVMRDGSGLSRSNRVSPAGLTHVLRLIAQRKDAKVFLDSLSVAGVDGTLRSRMLTAPCRGRILGKTGYLWGASCLSGYVLDTSGQPALAFSILLNRPGTMTGAKRLQEKICAVLVEALD